MRRAAVLAILGLPFVAGPALAQRWDVASAASGIVTPGNVASVNVQTFTVSATYTPTPKLLFAEFIVVGGGGSAGGVGAGTAAGVSAGAGAGSLTECFATAAQIGASATVTVGTGGAAPVAGANSGNNGNPSTVTSVAGLSLATTGGAFSSGNANTVTPAIYTGGAAGALPGAPCGGATVILANRGGFGTIGLSTGAVAGSYSGTGGPGPLGGGSNPRTITGQDGAVAVGYGTGGGGAFSAADSTAHAGAAGAAGVVIVKEYLGG